MGDDDRTADGAAELVLVQGVSGCGEVAVRVEYAIAQKLECGAMELITARLGDDVDHPARALAELRVVVAGLYAELLQRVRERERVVHVGHLIHVVAAIQKIVRLVGQRSIHTGNNGNGKCLANALIGSIAFGGCVDHAGNQRYERGRISAVQRQIDDACLVDDLGQGAAGGGDLGNFGGDLDRLVGCAERKLHPD